MHQGNSRLVLLLRLMYEIDPTLIGLSMWCLKNAYKLASGTPSGARVAGSGKTGEAPAATKASKMLGALRVGGLSERYGAVKVAPAHNNTYRAQRTFV